MITIIKTARDVDKLADEWAQIDKDYDEHKRQLDAEIHDLDWFLTPENTTSRNYLLKLNK